MHSVAFLRYLVHKRNLRKMSARSLQTFYSGHPFFSFKSPCTSRISLELHDTLQRRNTYMTASSFTPAEFFRDNPHTITSTFLSHFSHAFALKYKPHGRRPEHCLDSVVHIYIHYGSPIKIRTSLEQPKTIIYYSLSWLNHLILSSHLLFSQGLIFLSFKCRCSSPYTDHCQGEMHYHIIFSVKSWQCPL